MAKVDSWKPQDVTALLLIFCLLGLIVLGYNSLFKMILFSLVSGYLGVDLRYRYKARRPEKRRRG